MAISMSAGNQGQSAPIANMNTTPLVDVMLVLLIIFMIAAPLLVHRSDLRIPIKGPPDKQVVKDEPWTLSLDPGAQGAVFHVDGQNIERSQLPALLRQVAASTPQPAFNLQANPQVSFDEVARIVALAQRSGFTKVGFDELRARN